MDRSFTLAKPPNSEHTGKLTLFPLRPAALHPRRPTKLVGLEVKNRTPYIHGISGGYRKEENSSKVIFLLSKDHMVGSMERHDT